MRENKEIKRKNQKIKYIIKLTERQIFLFCKKVSFMASSNLAKIIKDVREFNI